jgi:hypothetical protein
MGPAHFAFAFYGLAKALPTRNKHNSGSVTSSAAGARTCQISSITAGAPPLPSLAQRHILRYWPPKSPKYCALGTKQYFCYKGLSKFIAVVLKYSIITY